VAISGAQPASTLAEHEAEMRRLASRKEKNLRLKEENLLSYGKVYAYGAVAAMAIQILIADAVFYLYGHNHLDPSGHHRWHISDGAIQVWLAATVIEVIGIVLVIAKSLFPSDDFSISLFKRSN
jgi:hypothetical protein